MLFFCHKLTNRGLENLLSRVLFNNSPLLKMSVGYKHIFVGF
jgi:hypothetical protein